MATSNRWLLAEEGYARSPVICTSGTGRPSIAWISAGQHGEIIKFSYLKNDGNWAAPVACSRTVTGIFAIAMAPFQNGVVATWIEDGVSSDTLVRLMVRRDDGGSDVSAISDGYSRPAHPAVVSDGETIWVFVTFRHEGGRVLKAAVGQDIAHLSPWRTLSDERAMALYPAAAARGGRCAVVWQEMKGRANRVWFHEIASDGERFDKVLLSLDDAAISAMPAVCPARQGWWTAWQSDRDPETGPGLVRSLEIAQVSDDGAVRIPSRPVPGIERFGKSEDQGFEFPKLIESQTGLVIVGRGSQSIRRQDLFPSGFGAPVRIDNEGWSCRGRRPTVAIADDYIYVAYRGVRGIAVAKLPPSDETAVHPGTLVARAPLQGLRPSTPHEKKRLLLSGYRVLFGDIHQHTALSDGTGTCEETYYRARVRYGDDVVAVSDHEAFLGKKTPAGEWRECCRIANEFYEPKKFVTLQAYEWTGAMHPGPGHKVIYLPSAGGPLFSRDDKKTNTSEGLLKSCRKIGAVVIPHHVGWTGADLENHLPSVQTCFEVVSCHGAYEKPDFPTIGTRGDDKKGQFIADALDRNLRFGLTGGSDGHGLSWHHGISRIQDSHRTGLTAFLCHEVTREAVLDALRKRRCYATSGAKIGLWFEVDGRPMGEELVAGDPVPFRVLVTPTAPITALNLVTNSRVEISLDFKLNGADVHGTLPPPPKNGFAFYFVRVTQEDGHVAWSSPIWLDPLASA